MDYDTTALDGYGYSHKQLLNMRPRKGSKAAKLKMAYLRSLRGKRTPKTRRYRRTRGGAYDLEGGGAKEFWAKIKAKLKQWNEKRKQLKKNKTISKNLKKFQDFIPKVAPIIEKIPKVSPYMDKIKNVTDTITDTTEKLGYGYDDDDFYDDYFYD